MPHHTSRRASSARRSRHMLTATAALVLLTSGTLSGCSESSSVAAEPAATSATDIKPAPALDKPYELVWNDEFDSAGIDPEKWSQRYPGKQKRREGINSPDATTATGDGYLRLTTLIKDGKLLSAMMGTQNTFTSNTGYFEARIKFQDLIGHHGAFWLQGVNESKAPGTKGSEIDIIEFFGDSERATDALHAIYPTGTSNEGTQGNQEFAKIVPDVSGIVKPGEALSDNFHVYGVEWTSEGYRFFIDGKETGRTTKAIANRDVYIVLSLVSSDWENAALDVDALPDDVTVDYVRVFHQK